MTSPAELDASPGSPAAAPRRRSRTWWMLVAAAPCAVVGAASLAWSAWYGLVRHHAKWDDFLLVGLVWFATAIGCAVLLRVIWALVAPERWLPRWLAATVLVLAIGVALAALGYVWFASSFGP